MHKFVLSELKTRHNQDVQRSAKPRNLTNLPELEPPRWTKETVEQLDVLKLSVGQNDKNIQSLEDIEQGVMLHSSSATSKISTLQELSVSSTPSLQRANTKLESLNEFCREADEISTPKEALIEAYCTFNFCC